MIGPRSIGPFAHFYQRLNDGKMLSEPVARRDFVFVETCAGCFACDRRNRFRGLSFFLRQGVAIKELYDAVVEAMGLTEYPEPEIRELEPDDAPSILLDPPEPSRISGRWNLHLFWRLRGLAWNTSANLGPQADILI